MNAKRFKYRPTFSVLFLISFILLTGCFGPQPACCYPDPEITEPDWFENPPADDGEFVYVNALGSSANQQLACTKASISGNINMKYKQDIYQGKFSKFFSENVPTSDPEFREYFDSALSAYSKDGELKYLEVERQEIEIDRSTGSTEFVCKQLQKMPKTEILNKLERHLMDNEDQYAKFKASSFYDDFRALLDQ